MQSNSNLHIKQTRHQIFVPLFITVVAVVGMAVLVLISEGPNTVMHWSHISLIILVVPMMLMVLFLILLLLLLIYGTGKLLRVLPTYSKIIQSYTYLLAVYILTAAHKLLQPIFLIRSVWASYQKLLSYLRRIS